MDKKEFRKVMAILFTSYRQDIDVAVADAYYLWLKNYPLEDFKSAVYDTVKKFKFFPSISEIIGEMVGSPTTEIDVKADIVKQIQDTGIYGSPEFKHDISQAVVNDVGWSNLCKMSDKELHDTVHFRYLEVADMWRACGLEGRPFLVELNTRRVGGGLKDMKQLINKTIKRSENEN